jgi:tRNA threonylcarbamoyladenosine biosynthesis protein TsaE
MHEKTIFLENSSDTEKLARIIGENVKGGECFELSSDIGGGKTTFTRGLVAGMGSLDHVSSPTFTLKNQYDTKNFTCYHFDFYRLQDPGLVREELAESLQDKDGVIVVEWAGSVEDVLPEKRIIIEFLKTAENFEHRKIKIKLPTEFIYLLLGVS